MVTTSAQKKEQKGEIAVGFEGHTTLHAVIFRRSRHRESPFSFLRTR